MLDNRTRFRHLQGFLSVALHRRVRTAADAPSITQPALSPCGSWRLPSGFGWGKVLQHAAASVASQQHEPA